VHRLEDQDRQHRRERQRDEAGQHDRRGHRDRELAVEHADGPGMKATGTNTEVITRVIAMMAPLISPRTSFIAS
jgi:hypothetical protein